MTDTLSFNDWQKIMMGVPCPYPHTIIFGSPSEYTYEDRRGGKHTSLAIATFKDAEYAREDYYNSLLEQRNWLQRLFNIKPSMELYDSIHRRVLPLKESL